MEELPNKRAAQNRRLAILRRGIRLRSDPFDLPDVEFVKNFRLSKMCVAALYNEVEGFLTQGRYGGVTKMTKLLTTLNVFAHGSYQRGIGNSFHLGLAQTTVSKVVNEVTDVLNMPQIAGNHIVFPQNAMERERIVRGFNDKFNVPGVLGCIDCTHVALIRPSEHEERFYCRKRYHSRNVQIICDSNLLILNVDPSYGGATHDSFVWRYHELHDHMQELYNNGESIWLFGDQGYAQRPWLMTPILQAEPGTPERHYYDKHCEVRNTVERCIGVLKARFRCLLAHRTLHYHHLKVAKIVNACCVLHNIAMRAGLPIPFIRDEEVIADRARQQRRILNILQLRQLYTDLELGRFQRQRLVERLWNQRN